MRKLTSILTGTLAFTLVFGMTVFAADSKTTENVKDPGKSTVVTSETVGFDETEVLEDMSKDEKDANDRKASELNTVNKSNTTATVGEKTVTPDIKPVSTAVAAKLDEVAGDLANKAAKAAAGDKEAGDVKVKAAAEVDLSATGITQSDIDKNGGIDLTIDFGTSMDNSGEKKYMLLHLRGETTWEAVPIIAFTTDGKVTARFSSLSPVALSEFVLVEADDDDGDDSSSGSASSETSSTSTKTSGKATSPKTGESVPFAGVLAVLALAGAAVSVTKVRYNR